MKKLLDLSLDIPLSKLLDATSILTGQSRAASSLSEPNLESLLTRRLEAFQAYLATLISSAILPIDVHAHETSALRTLQERTADAALWLMQGIDHATSAIQADIPLLGVRDLSLVRTLNALIIQWGVLPSSEDVLSTYPLEADQGTGSHLSTPDDSITTENLPFARLRERLSDIFGVISDGQSVVGHELILHHSTAILKAYIALANYPGVPGLVEQNDIERLLQLMPPSQTMASLGAILAQLKIPILRSVCGKLLSRKLLEPGGFLALCDAVLGESTLEDDIEAPLNKFQMIAKIVSAVPAGLNRKNYFDRMLPELLLVFVPPAGDLTRIASDNQQRAAAFTIGRVLASNPSTSREIMRPILHLPFCSLQDSSSPAHSILITLESLAGLFAHSDPSPILPRVLLGPIISQLYSLLSILNHTRTSDPVLISLVSSLFRVWGRTADRDEFVRGVCKIIESGNGWGKACDWEWSFSGRDVLIKSSEQPVGQMMPLNVPDIQAILNGDDSDSMILRPRPIHLVSTLKSLDRRDGIGEVFNFVLSNYQKLQEIKDQPIETLLYARIILELLQQLGARALDQPLHILPFVLNALENYQHGSVRAKKPDGQYLDLRLPQRADPTNDVRSDLLEDENDSDDEGEADYHQTALNLLLSLLEAHESLTPLNTPILASIELLVAKCSLDANPSIRTVAREARLVLTARRAQAAGVEDQISRASKNTTVEVEAQTIYQEALRLLQDPLLPVRAHGLVMLRQLVAASSPHRTAVRPLKPAILSVFLQGVQDDDSYIFLNAVQGLVAMVDLFGEDVMKGLVEAYTTDLLDQTYIPNVTKVDLDRRIRVGEAISQSIKTCGMSLGGYAELLVPALFHVFRKEGLPISLRISALSLLADCVHTSPTALLPWWETLCSGMLDLLQLSRLGSMNVGETDVKDPALPSSKPQEALDADPTSTNTGIASFRRSAIHFLRSILEVSLGELPDAGRFSLTSIDASNIRLPPAMQRSSVDEAHLSAGLMEKIYLTLEYLSATDTDRVARIMAGEALESLQRYRMSHWTSNF